MRRIIVSGILCSCLATVSGCNEKIDGFRDDPVFSIKEPGEDPTSVTWHNGPWVFFGVEYRYQKLDPFHFNGGNPDAKAYFLQAQSRTPEIEKLDEYADKADADARDAVKTDATKADKAAKSEAIALAWAKHVAAAMDARVMLADAKANRVSKIAADNFNRSQEKANDAENALKTSIDTTIPSVPTHPASPVAPSISPPPATTAPSSTPRPSSTTAVTSASTTLPNTAGTSDGSAIPGRDVNGDYDLVAIKLQLGSV